MKKLYILALLMFLFTLGCIYEYPPIDLSQQSQPFSTYYFDINLDNKSDIAKVSFNPVNVFFAGQTVTVKRGLYLYPTNINLVENPNESLDLTEINSGLEELTQSLNSITDSCKKAFNFDLCVDINTCKDTCGYGSRVCKEASSNEVGALLLDYANLYRRLDSELNNLKLSINLKKKLEETEVKQLARIYVLKESLKKHPANKDFVRCNFELIETPTFDRSLEAIKDDIDVNEYQLFVYTLIDGESLINLVNVFMKEEIPIEAHKYIDNIIVSDLDKKEPSFPIVINYHTFSLTEGSGNILVYRVVLDKGFDPQLLNGWNKVIVNLRFIEYSLVQVDAFLKKLENVYFLINLMITFPYLSFAITISWLIVVFMIIWFSLKVFYFVIMGFIRRRGISESVRMALGYATEAPLQRAAKAVVLFLFGLLIEYLFLSRAPLETFGFFSIREFLEKDPFSIISVSSYLLSFYFFFSLTSDVLKGILIGKDYFREVLESTATINRLRLRKLKEMVTQAKAELERYSSEGIEVGEEYGVITKIPIVELENQLEKEDPKIMRNRLERYIEEVREVLVSVRTKEEVARKNWNEWKNYLAEQLAKKDNVSLDTLLLIPHQWRVWAINRYMEEFPDEDLVLEGKILKKKKILEEEKIKRVINLYKNKGVLVAAVLVKNYNPVVYVSTLPKEGVLLNLLFNLFTRLLVFTQKTFKMSPIEFKAYGAKYIIGAVYKGKYNAVYIAPKEKEKDVEYFIYSLEKY